MDGVIIIRNIKVEAANAIAGMTWGFPAMTHFLGYIHALQRKLPTQHQVTLNGCGVVCHQHHTLSHKASSYSDAVFSLSRNPLDKSGKSSSFNEEARINMEVSLLIAVTDNDSEGIGNDEIADLETALFDLAQSQRLAGGTIVNQPRVKYLRYDAFADKHDHYMRSLLPGFCLVSRHDLLLERQQYYQEQNADNPELQAWLSFSTITYAATQNKQDPEKAKWTHQAKPYTGWVRPITVGYRAISPLYKPGQVAKTRDADTPSQFVENLYSIGQWISPHRINKVSDMCWHYHTTDNGDYLCRNHYAM